MAVSTDTGSQQFYWYGIPEVDLYPGEINSQDSVGTQDFWVDGSSEGFLFFASETPPPGEPFWKAGDGIIGLEMDCCNPDNEVLDNALNELEQLRCADFWKIKKLMVRTDTFGFPLTKYRASGPMEWGNRITVSYNDLFDIAIRYFVKDDKTVWAYFDLDQLYHQITFSADEVATNYVGEQSHELIFLWSSKDGKRYYTVKTVSETNGYDFVSDEIESGNFDDAYYFPETFMIRARPSAASFSQDSSIWGEYRNIAIKMIERIVSEFQKNSYHNIEGIVVKLPFFRDFSYGPKDLLLYNQWLADNGYSEVITETSISTTKDSYIYSGSPNTNYGTAAILVVSRSSSVNSNRTLIEFDLSAVPTHQQIARATLKLYCTYIRNVDMEMQVWALDESWEETQVTWNSRYTGVPWTTAGGTFSKMYARHNITDADLNNWVEMDITELVREWVSGERPNYGVIIIPNYLTAVTFPAGSNFQSEESVYYNEPRIVVEYGDFPKVNDSLPVSESNPYIRDHELVWRWKNDLITSFLQELLGQLPVVPITNSDFWSEVDVAIPSYGDTAWAGVEMAYTRTDDEGYTRTVGVPNSIEKFSLQWGLDWNALDSSSFNYVGVAVDPTNSRFQTGRVTDFIDALENQNLDKYVALCIGNNFDELESSSYVRPRDIEELIRYARKYDYRWMVYGSLRIPVTEEELPFWSSVSQAVNDMGNTWDSSEWVPPESFDIQVEPLTEQSISLGMQQVLVTRYRSSLRRIPFATVRMVWPPLEKAEMGFLQRLYQFGKVIQWDVANQRDVDVCQWESAVRVTVNGEVRYYGSFRSWRSGTVRVKVNGTEVYHNDPVYGWTPFYEEGYLVFDNTPSSDTEVTIYYQCRMTLLAQSIVPSDNVELYRKTLFLPVEVIFKEVR